jgi:hypothetical protein
VAACCRFLGQAEQKNGQHREVSADFEHSLDKLKTSLEKTKIVMQMFNSTKFETTKTIIITKSSLDNKLSHNNSILKNSEIRI